MEDKERFFVGRRLSSLYGMTLVIIGILLMRLAELQLLQGQSWKVKASSYRQDEWAIPAARGNIYDRNHQLLVTNQASFSLYFTPLGLRHQDYQTMAERIASLIGKPAAEVERKMDVAFPYRAPASDPRCLMRGLSMSQVAYLSEHRADLPGMTVVTEPKRQYLTGKLACHILGYLNSIPADSEQKYKMQGYRPDERVGVFGVERSYESQLHGKAGLVRVKVNHLNQPIDQEILRSPVKGNDVILSIDSRLQSVMEETLATQVAKINSNPKLKRVSNAMAVAMNPQTGEVLAMASYPEFDPGWWVNGIDEKIYRNQFSPAEMNRAIQQPVAPGSTIKPATVLLGLEKQVISPYTRVFDSGRLQVGWNQGKPHYLYCWDHHGHGSVTARKALAVSCNVYMYNLSLELGGWSNYLLDANSWITNRLPGVAHTLEEYYRQFGLGKSTGIDLDEEQTGYMGKARVLADLPFIAIGQHESYTAIELAQYVSVLANGGNRVEPHVVKEVRSNDGRVVQTVSPRVLNHVPFRQDYLSVVRHGMEDVINSPYGTAYSSFRGTHYTAAGKTGTAETGVGEDNALFVGYAPIYHPEVAISVIVPGGGHGADSSVPIARKILDGYFSLKKVNSAGKIS